MEIRWGGQVTTSGILKCGNLSTACIRRYGNGTFAQIVMKLFVNSQLPPPTKRRPVMTLERYACDGKMYRYGENGVQQGEWVKADEANAEITYLKTLLDEARDLR